MNFKPLFSSVVFESYTIAFLVFKLFPLYFLRVKFRFRAAVMRLSETVTSLHFVRVHWIFCTYSTLFLRFSSFVLPGFEHLIVTQSN